MPSETLGNAAVSWLPSPHHPYEDRFRLLAREVPLVAKSGRGEIYAVFDGVGSAPKGMAAAQTMADCLLGFFTEPAADLASMLNEANQTVSSWGVMEGSDRPLGASVGTVAHILGDRLTVIHAGDTVAVLLRSDKPPKVLTSLQERGGAVYSYFGIGAGLELEIAQATLEEDDLVLLLSDGVTKAFHIYEATKLVLDRYARTGSCVAAISELVELSRRRGSSDDITAILVAV